MKTLLRSMFKLDSSDRDELLLRNFLKFNESGLEFDETADRDIWDYLKRFTQAKNHVPDFQTLFNHFEREKKIEALDRLEMLKGVSSITRGDFEAWLENKVHLKRVRQTTDVLKEAETIIRSGLEIQDGKSKKLLKGPRDAIKHVIEVGQDIIKPTFGTRLTGEIISDTEDFKARYNRIEADPLAGIGQFTGIDQLDRSLRGAKKFELWTHAAFTGGLKCVAGDTEIFDVKTGLLKTVKEIYEKGELPLVHALDESTWNIVKAPVSHVEESGVRDIIEVKTQSGRTIKVSGNHPFMTNKGWVKAEELTLEHWVSTSYQDEFKSFIETKVEDCLPTSLIKDSPSCSKIAQEYLECDELSNFSRLKFTKFASHLKDEKLLRIAKSPVRWEKVISLTSKDQEMTYDLSVPSVKNFIANGFITHNSTFMLNWAYNQAIYFRHGSFICSLEMPYYQVRNILYAMHTYNSKFTDIRLEMGLQKDPDEPMGLHYEKIRDGLLTPLEKKFLFDVVCTDFNDPRNEYGSIRIEVADPDKMDFTMVDLKALAERCYSKDPFSTLFVDHLGLVAPQRRTSSTTENLNEVMRSAKRIAMNFNRGMGMAVVGLFQIGREGYKHALKNNGMYNLTHLSYSNECAISGTKTYTYTGFKDLEKVQPGDLVWSSTGWKKVLAFFDQGKKRTYTVTTDRGDQLGCTGNHRVRVLHDGYFDWCIARKLQEGDYLVSSTNYPFAQKVPSLDPIAFTGAEKREDRYGNLLSSPTEVTKEFAYLLGAWDGDGNVRCNGIEYTGNRKELAVCDKIQSYFKETFNQPLEKQEYESRPGSFELSRWSQPLKRWFEKIAGSRGKEVPQVIWQSPRYIICAYLQGLFDTDGWINPQGVIGIQMASENFLRDIQMLLFGLGLDCCLVKVWSTIKGKKYPGWTLRLRGKYSTQLFRELINFTEPYRQERVVQFCKGPVNDKRTYPVPQTFLKAYAQVHPKGTSQKGIRRAFFNAHRLVEKNGLVRHTDIQTLLDLAKNRSVESSELDFLSRLLSLRFSSVSKVESTGKVEQVWDIEVEGDHEYQTGGLLSHNCERSSDVVTSTWVDDDMKKASLVQYQCLKTRDHEPFDPFRAQVEWSCRKIKTLYEVDNMVDEELELSGDDLEDLFND